MLRVLAIVIAAVIMTGCAEILYPIHPVSEPVPIMVMGAQTYLEKNGIVKVVQVEETPIVIESVKNDIDFTTGVYTYMDPIDGKRYNNLVKLMCKYELDDEIYLRNVENLTLREYENWATFLHNLEFELQALDLKFNLQGNLSPAMDIIQKMISKTKKQVMTGEVEEEVAMLQFICFIHWCYENPDSITAKVLLPILEPHRKNDDESDMFRI